MLLQAEAEAKGMASAQPSIPSAAAPPQAGETDSFLLKPLKARDAAQMGISAQPERKVHSPSKEASGGQGRKGKASVSSAEPASGHSRAGQGRWFLVYPIAIPQSLGCLTHNVLLCLHPCA